MILRIWVVCILTLLPLAAPTQEPARCIELGPAANADGQYIIPLLIDSMDDFISADIYILFNSEQIASVEARRTDLLAGFFFLTNPVADTLKVAFAGIQATTGSGTFAEILVPDTGVKPEFVLFMISLNGDQIPVKFDGPTDVRQISGPQPTTLNLAPNFPNPFNAKPPSPMPSPNPPG